MLALSIIIDKEEDTQLTFTCSKSRIKILKNGVKYVQS